MASPKSLLTVPGAGTGRQTQGIQEPILSPVCLPRPTCFVGSGKRRAVRRDPGGKETALPRVRGARCCTDTGRDRLEEFPVRIDGGQERKQRQREGTCPSPSRPSTQEEEVGEKNTTTTQTLSPDGQSRLYLHYKSQSQQMCQDAIL
ncbi:unnamed protein product [Lepidochelys kempii]